MDGGEEYKSIYEYDPNSGFTLRQETIAQEAEFPIIIPYNDE